MVMTEIKSLNKLPSRDDWDDSRAQSTTDCQFREQEDADYKKCPEIRLEILKMANQRRFNNCISDWRVTVFATCIAALLIAPLMLEPCGTAGIAFAQAQESPSRAQDEKN